jgi:anti-anti-sigma factor
MTRIYHSVAQTPITVPENLHELVRGEEQRLLKELEPAVQEHSVTLDMRQIERIDAAGIAALITLYGTACAAGHSFTLINASHRVREILALVKLDRILLSEHQAPRMKDDPCYAMPAA